jgi:Zn-dependent protease
VFGQSSGAFDIRFRVGPWPVVVEPSFWLISVLFGWGQKPELIAAWVIICFASILIHEIGHATVSRVFGSEAYIRLYSFGGLCVSDRSLGRWRDLLRALGGPVAGFLLAGLLWGVHHLHPPDNRFGEIFYRQAMWVNLGWGLINLIPALPLDGGHVMENLIGPKRRRAVAIGSCLGCALGVGLGAWWSDSYLIVLFGFLGFRSLGLLADTREKKQPTLPPEPNALARGWEALRGNQPREATRLGLSALDAARRPATRNAARDLLAWAALASDDVADAQRQLKAVTPPEEARALSWAMVLDEANEPARALPYALAALDKEPSPASAKLALRLLTIAGRFEEASAVISRGPWRSEDERTRRKVELDLARGQERDAEASAQLLFARTQAAEDALLCARASARSSIDTAVEWIGRAVEAGLPDADEALESAPELKPLIGSAALAERLSLPKVTSPSSP